MTRSDANGNFTNIDLQFHPFPQAFQRVRVDLVFLQLLVVPQSLEYPEHLCHPVVHRALWVPSLPLVRAFLEGQEVPSLQEIQVIQRVRVDLVDLAGLEAPKVPPYHFLPVCQSLLGFLEVQAGQALPAVPSHQLCLKNVEIQILDLNCWFSV